MAKRRVTNESGVSGAGASPARSHRKHSTASAPPPAPSPISEEQAGAAVAKAVAKNAPAPVAGGDEIARLAYSYWESRGFEGGSPEEDWLRAERELRSRNNA
jgi:hypothetical protein